MLIIILSPQLKAMRCLQALEAEMFLDKCIRDFAINRLQVQIDAALDCGNHEEFVELSQQLRDQLKEVEA